MKLARAVGRWGLFTTGFGCIVGSAWVVVLGDWFAAAGPGGTLVGLAAGTLVVLAIAAAYAELASRMPVAGGDFEYVRRVFGPGPAFAVGWFTLLALLSVTAFEGIALSWMLSTLLPPLRGDTLYVLFGQPVTSGDLAIGLAGVAAVGLLNYRGVGLVARLQVVVTFAFLAVACAVMLAGLGMGTASPLADAFVPTKPQPWWHGALWVLSLAPFMLNGFQSIPQLAEERAAGVDTRTVANAMYAAIVASALFYGGMVLAAGTATDWRTLPAASLPAAAAFEDLVPGGTLVTALLVAATLSILKTWNGIVVWAARLALAQARVGFLPRTLAAVHPRYGSPAHAVIAIVSIGALGVLLGRGVVLPLLGMTSICGAFVMGLVCAAALRARRAAAESTEIYAVPGGALVLGAGMIGAIAMAAVALGDALFGGAPGGRLQCALIVVWAGVGVLAWRVATRPGSGRGAGAVGGIGVLAIALALTIAPTRAVANEGDRTIDFTTREGTWMSVSAPPAADWLAFDLLGHVYRVPASGGAAECLTQDSGRALNYQPVVSPDGRTIAFVSDRGGQDALWAMNSDGSSPRLVFQDANSRIAQPAWSPDGRALVAVRNFATALGMWRRSARLWLFPLDGGAPRELVGDTQRQYYAPAFSPDGRYVYLHSSAYTGSRFGTEAAFDLRRLDLRTGEMEVIAKAAPGAARTDAIVSDASAVPPRTPNVMAPLPSPDGRWLAYARQMPDETVEYRGHEYAPRTALYLRDLRDGSDRRLLDRIDTDMSYSHAMYTSRHVPGYAWRGDSRALLLTLDGGLARVNVGDGAIERIPFEARVRRTAAPQARPRATIDDTLFESRFPQWPTAAPGRSAVAFVAVGRVWVQPTPDAAPRRVTRSTGDEFEFTPAWSPDGRRVAYVTWSRSARGHLWIADASGRGPPRRVTQVAGEYLNPAWSPDGRTLAFTRGPGPVFRQSPNGWAAPTGWQIATIDVRGGEARRVADTLVPQRPTFGADGRIRFQDVVTAPPTGMVRVPYPDRALLERRVFVRSVSPQGGPTQDHVSLPFLLDMFAPDGGNDAVLSPDGRYLAWQSAQRIWVQAMDGSRPPVRVDILGAARIAAGDGIFHRWVDANVLEFADGPRYVRFDVRTGERAERPLRLALPKPRSERRLAFTNARIVTMAGDRVLERATLVVRGARIECVGECPLDAVERVIDASGRTIVPGLIDLHEHTTAMPFPASVVPQRPTEFAVSLAYGVTTILDPAGKSSTSFPLAELVAAGLVTGPRVYTSAEIVRSWGDQAPIESLDDARREVARRADWGALVLKNYRQMRREQQAWLVEAARERGVGVTSEGGSLETFVGQALDGQSGIEHPLMFLPARSDIARLLAATGVVYSPTLLVAGHPEGAGAYLRGRHDFEADTKYRRFLPDAAERARAQGAVPRNLRDFAFPIQAETVADVIRAGGYAGIGEHAEQPGLGSLWEVWVYGRALRPIEALRMATLYGAHALGLERELGSLEPGKLADLVVLDADPLADLRNLEKIAYVMQAGVLYDAGTLDATWPEARHY